MPGTPTPADDAFFGQLREFDQQLRQINSWIQQQLGTWESPVLEHSWVQSGTATVGFRLESNRVRLRGRISGGTSGTVAFTLPEGFRPTQQFYTPIMVGGVATGYVVIQPSGTVTVGFASEGGTPSFDNVTFPIN